MNFQVSFTMRNLHGVTLLVCLITNLKLAQAQMCAMLYKGQNYTGEQFPLIDGSSVINFEEEYVSVETVWNRTGSFHLEPSCVLTSYNETNFQGILKEYRSSQTNPNQDMDTLHSASCECHKNCKCSDIKMRKNSCARLYFNGCNVCNPMYTDLIKTSKSFSDEFSGTKKAIKVRSGCSLTIYPEEDEEGDEVVVDSSEDYWNYEGVIGSYTCECNASGYVPIPKVPRPPTYPKMINIPSTIEEVSRMIQNSAEPHPGLLAAMNSLKVGRSSRNAYILTVGSTGSGKSSAINLLFDNPTLTEVGVGSSVTTDIHEFRISVPVDEKGIQNSELRVIDTPGLMDTRGLEQDAKFLATLDEYLANHEELHNRIPNVVFVFHKFTDNRFNGSGSNFVKMLRGLDSFKGRITDSSYSNVVFVLSHFCGETNKITKKPTERLAAFKKVIQEFSLFPKPIVIAVAENKADEHSRPLVNGYYKLPNGDFYPKNLFDKIQKLTSSAGDEIGDAVIRTAFRGSGDFNISHTTYSLVGQGNKKVSKYFKVMMDVTFPFEETEVSLLLERAEEGMNPELRKSYPDTLKYLQGALNLRNIRSLVDIPKTTLDILELITALRQNPAILYLLETGLKIVPPQFPGNAVAGHNYHIFKDAPLSRSPFALGQGTTSDIGFMFPASLSCSVERKMVDIIQFRTNRTDYIQKRLSKLGIEGNIAGDRFTGEIKPGYNIRSESSNGSCSLSAVREIRTFQLVLQDKPPLSEEFKRVLLALPVYNETDHENVLVWNNFFDNYGTHVVSSVYGGGAIEISLQTQEACDLTKLSAALFQVIQFAEDLTSIHAGNGTGLSSQSGNSHQLKFRGGDPKYYTNDLTKMTLDDASALLSNWKKSLALNPTILTTDIGLIPIGDVAKKVGTKQNITTEIVRATALYFQSQLKYRPKLQEAASYEGRDDIPAAQSFSGFNTIIQMMMNQSAESNKRFETMMEKFEEARLANEARLQAEREAQRIWEREQEARRQNAAEKAADDRRRDEKARQDVLDAFRREQAQKDADWRAEQARAEAARRTAQDAINKRNHDLMVQIANRPPPRTSSCLRTGTLITLGDGRTKAVELLEVGDLVLDHNLQVWPVLGITYEFLQSQSYYGFDNESFFFTDSHIFAGPGKGRGNNGSEPGLQYYVQNLPWLLEQNPLMEFIEAVEMSVEESFDIFKLVNSSKAVESEAVTVHKDSSPHSESDRIYFMQVDGPFGTYFANGYLCKHEIPPLDHWQNTMAVLYKLFRTRVMEFVASQEYTKKFIDISNRISEDIRDSVLATLQFKNTKSLETGKIQVEIEFDLEEGQDVLDGVFSNPSVAAMATKIYATTSKSLSNYLDNPNSEHYVGHGLVRGLQNQVYVNMVEQFAASVEREFANIKDENDD